MSEVVLEIEPSFKDRNSHRGLGYAAATLALLLLLFNFWLITQGGISIWTHIILFLPVLLFASISWFVLRFGKGYVVGFRVTDEGLGPVYPMLSAPAPWESFVRYEEISLLVPEETLELHRTGRKVQRFNVYRIYVTRNKETEPELLVDMHNLKPEQILLFRQFPKLILEKGYLRSEQVDLSRMP